MSNKSLGRGLSAFLDLNAPGKEDDFEKSISRMEERKAKQAKEHEEQQRYQPGSSLYSDRDSNSDGYGYGSKTGYSKNAGNGEGSEDFARESRAEVVRIKIADIVANPYQPRKKFDEEALHSLAESIKRKGVLQPILVVKNADENGSSAEQYQLVAGERRFRASQLAGLEDIPAIVSDLDQRDQLEVAILENIQREDLNPVEEAEAYRRLMNEFEYTQEQLSEVLGKSRSHIANILRLLNLPDDVKDMLQSKTLSFGHARALVGAENASEIAKRVIEKGMSVRETEELLKSLKDVKKMMDSAASIALVSSAHSQDTSVDGEAALSEPSCNLSTASFTELLPASAYIDPELLNVANQISSKIGLQVSIKMNGKGKGDSARSGGTIEIFFKDFEDLDKLLGRLHGQQ